MIEYYKEKDIGIAENAPQLTAALGISPVLAELLCARGYDTVEKAKEYLDPVGCSLQPPMTIKGMREAVDTVLNAMAQDKLICVFGDYDVDGIMAVTILSRFLKEQGARVTEYIPSRHTEGYGLNVQAIESLAEQGVGLMITVDCGVTALEEVALAVSLGMEVVVTDHHQCVETLPDCAAVVDPARPDETCAYRCLCGAGVALKLVQALGGTEAAEKAMDCAALATLADIVPLTGENRTIVAKGLERINAGDCLIGISEMIRVSGYEGRVVNSGAVSFGIAPRINAAGRTGSARTALELFLTDDRKKAAALAKELDEENSRRRAIETEIYKEAMDMIAGGSVDLVDDDGIILVGKGWNHGVIGIVASKLVERYCRPVILLSEEDGVCVGSGRSVRGVHLFDTLNSMAELFVRFGGHEMAAGLTIECSRLEEFRGRFCDYLKQNVERSVFVPKARYDAQVPAAGLTLALAEELQRMAPFGMGNPAPVFRLRGEEAVDPVTMGAQGRHLRFSIERRGQSLKCVAFGSGEMQEELVGAATDILGTLEINDFRGERNEQLIVRNICTLPADVPQEYIKANAGKFSDAILAMSRYNRTHEQTGDKPQITFASDWREVFARWLDQRPFGSVAVCATARGAQLFMEAMKDRLHELDIHFGTIRDERACNAVLLAPLPGELSRYKRILLMEALPQELAESFGGSRTEEFLSAALPCDGIAALEGLCREDLVPVYSAMLRLAAKRTDFAARSAYIKALADICPADADLIAIGAEVFAELGFFDVKEGGAYRVSPVKNAKKRQLTESKVLNAVKQLAARCAGR